MPLVKSLNDFKTENIAVSLKRCSELVSRITMDIIRDSPSLVVDVENGTVDRKVLKTAVIRNIDRNRYYTGIGRDELLNKVFDSMFGYWELERYIKDDEVSDIDGTRYDHFTIKKCGKAISIPFKFGNEKQFDSFCRLVAVRNGGILNENDSHCRVSDEKNRLRINISIRPRNISGPAINIRKHRKESYNLDELQELGMLNGEIKSFLNKLSASGANVVFCGRGAAGKTTLLRAFINSFTSNERVLVCESDSELYPESRNFIVQRIKKPNEGGLLVTLRDLVRDGLTMSLDTYVIGEIVGDEAWEFIKAGFTGHRVLATTHASSAEDSFYRLVTLIKSANVDHSEKTIKRMIGQSLDVVVFLKKFKVAEVIEVLGYDEDKDMFSINKLFEYWTSNEINYEISGIFRKCNEMSERLGDKIVSKVDKARRDIY